MTKIIPDNNGTKRDVVIRYAASMFREKGFAATSMRDIAERVGVEAPSLYNHIASKKEILWQICSAIAGTFISNLKEIESSSFASIVKVESIIRFHISMMIEEHESVYVSDHEWKHLPEPNLTEFKNQRRNYRSRLASLIQKGIDAGEINPVNPYVAVLMTLSAISGIDSWQRSSKKIDRKTLEENMVKLLVGGLKKQNQLHLV